MGEVEKQYLDDMKERELRVFLRSGYQEKGLLKDFDNDVIVLENKISGERSMIYRAYISTIKPM